MWLLDGSEEDLSFDLVSVGNGDDMPVVRSSLRDRILIYLQQTAGFHHPSVIAEAIDSSTEVVDAIALNSLLKNESNDESKQANWDAQRISMETFPTNSYRLKDLVAFDEPVSKQCCELECKHGTYNQSRKVSPSCSNSAAPR